MRISDWSSDVCSSDLIQAFLDDGLIATPGDIFRLVAHEAGIAEREGWGPQSAAKLVKAIQDRATVGLDRFIYALGIRQVGQATAKLLARSYGDLESWRDRKSVVEGKSVAVRVDLSGRG